MTYEKALKLAIDAHKGQKRWNGDDYITHPIRVAYMFKDDTHRIVAILHDVVEDTDWTILQLGHCLDIDEKIIDALIALTKKDSQAYADYIICVKKNPLATAVKIEDLKDNLRDLKKGQRRDKYELALKILEEKP